MQHDSGARMPTKVLLACALAGSATLLTGCALLLIGAGAAAGAGGVIWYKGRLEQRLQAPLAEVHEAAVKALEDAGLPVVENRSDKITGHLESEYADGKHVWIDSEAMGEASTRIRIRVGTLGDKARALDILDGVKRNLGLAPQQHSDAIHMHQGPPLKVAPCTHLAADAVKCTFLP